LPALISAAKVGFTLAVLGAVVAEFIHPDKGLGYLILVAQSSYNVEVIYVCVLLLIMQGIAVYGGLSVLENKIIRNRTR
jgi:NitT/TauT family transport system permease protein